MIKVKNLTKKYVNTLALNDISFEIKENGVYGFLGPNGAGKSTAMNIITGVLASTEGQVSIGGYDIFEEPIKAKSLIGYLPETPPLYPELTPYEYLKFICRAKGIKKSDIHSEIERVMQIVDIIPVAYKQMKGFSKGYKQRVGIAAALVGDPKIIILDEPTSGLDPKQIIEIRSLIASLGEEHTVLFSTHILSEIQELCERVIIIGKGRILADDTLAELKRAGTEHPTVHIVARTDPMTAMDIVDEIEAVSHYAITECDEGTDMVLTLADKTDIRDMLFFAFANAGIALLTMSIGEQSIEELYLKLTESQIMEVEDEETSDTEEDYVSIFGEEV